MRKDITRLSRTRQAEKALMCAQLEAEVQGKHFAQSHHLLRALIQEPSNLSARLLQRLGVSLDEVRMEIKKWETEQSLFVQQTGQDQPISALEVMMMEAPELTGRMNPTLDLASDEAHRLNSKYIGTEHLL